MSRSPYHWAGAAIVLLAIVGVLCLTGVMH